MGNVAVRKLKTAASDPALSMLPPKQQSADSLVSHSYSASVLSSAIEVKQLAGLARQLLEHRDSTFQPDFFLATLTKNVWVPRVVVVREHGVIVGLVYAKERILAGFETGVIYADLTLGGMLFAESVDAPTAFLSTVKALAEKRGVWGLRVLVPPNGFELATLHLMSSAERDVSQSPVEYHSVLHLPCSYNLFLESLGRQTRRNFRYYRRLGAATSTFSDDLSLLPISRPPLSLCCKRM